MDLCPANPAARKAHPDSSRAVPGPNTPRGPRLVDSHRAAVQAVPEAGLVSASAQDLRVRDLPLARLAQEGRAQGLRRLKRVARNVYLLAAVVADSSSIPRPRKAR